MSSGYAVLRGLGAALTAVLVAGGAVSAAPGLVRSTETVELTWPAGAQELRLSPGPGRVEIREGSTPGFTVEQTWSFADPRPVVETGQDGAAAVHLDCAAGTITRCNADWEIVVPEGTGITLEGVVGDVSLSDVTGAVQVFGSAGDVRVSGSPDLLEVRVNLGDVRAQLDEPAQEVRLATNLGDVEVTVPGDVAYDIHSRSDVKEISSEVMHDPTSPHLLDLTTNLGEVRIRRS